MADHKPKTKRLFIAIPLTTVVNKALTPYCEKIAKHYPQLNPRFTPASKRHLTLAFWGALEPPQIEAAHQVVNEFIFPEINLQLTQIARFPDNQSKIITALAGNSKALTDLHATLQKSLEAHGFPQLARPFRPHISLTRIKNIGDELPMEITPPIELLVSEIILYESLLTEKGSCYIPMTHCQLKGSK